MQSRTAERAPQCTKSPIITWTSIKDAESLLQVFHKLSSKSSTSITELSKTGLGSSVMGFIGYRASFAAGTFFKRSRSAVPAAFCRSFQAKRGPAPPQLPKEEQEEFEKLQRIAQSQEAIDEYNREIENDTTKESAKSPILKADIGGFSPEFSKTIPEFAGDVNPKTGERGGPKQDPLKHGDYSFNGRVTDF